MLLLFMSTIQKISSLFFIHTNLIDYINNILTKRYIHYKFKNIRYFYFKSAGWVGITWFLYLKFMNSILTNILLVEPVERNHPVYMYGYFALKEEAKWVEQNSCTVTDSIITNIILVDLEFTHYILLGSDCEFHSSSKKFKIFLYWIYK